VADNKTMRTGHAAVLQSGSAVCTGQPVIACYFNFSRCGRVAVKTKELQTFHFFTGCPAQYAAGSRELPKELGESGGSPARCVAYDQSGCQWRPLLLRASLSSSSWKEENSFEFCFGDISRYERALWAQPNEGAAAGQHWRGGPAPGKGLRHGEPALRATPLSWLSPAARLVTPCSIGPLFAAEAAGEGEDGSISGRRAVPALAARAPSESPSAAALPERDVRGKRQVWGERRFSAVQLAENSEFSTKPALPWAGGKGQDSSSISCVVPLYNSLMCIFTIKCPSPGLS